MCSASGHPPPSPLQSLPVLWFNSSQGQWLQTSRGPGSLPGEIGHIPQSAVRRRLWYSITWEKFGTIWKLEKKKHESPWERPRAELACPTGSFILCRVALGAVGSKMLPKQGLGFNSQSFPISWLDYSSAHFFKGHSWSFGEQIHPNNWNKSSKF